MNSQNAARRPYHHGDLHNALIAAAIELVALKGQEGFSLREAARHVGVSPSAAYNHFQDKADLLAAVARQGFQRLALDMEEAMDAAVCRDGGAKGPLAKLDALGLAYVRFAVRHPAQFRVMLGPYGAGSDRSMRVEGKRGLEPYELLEELLDELVAAGVLAPQRRKGAEMPVWAAVHGLANMFVDGLLKAHDDDEVQRLFSMLAGHVHVGLGIVAPAIARPDAATDADAGRLYRQPLLRRRKAPQAPLDGGETGRHD